MGCKAKELFPFRGGLASAYAISKAYGLQHRTHLVQKRLRMGMPAEEAVKVHRDGPRSDVQGGIMPWEIVEMRDRIQVGQKILMVVEAASMGRESSVRRKENCIVLKKCGHFVILRRPCGLRISRTYPELFSEMRLLWREIQ